MVKLEETDVVLEKTSHFKTVLFAQRKFL